MQVIIPQLAVKCELCKAAFFEIIFMSFIAFFMLELLSVVITLTFSLSIHRSNISSITNMFKQYVDNEYMKLQE